MFVVPLSPPRNGTIPDRRWSNRSKFYRFFFIKQILPVLAKTFCFSSRRSLSKNPTCQGFRRVCAFHCGSLDWCFFFGDDSTVMSCRMHVSLRHIHVTAVVTYLQAIACVSWKMVGICWNRWSKDRNSTICIRFHPSNILIRSCSDLLKSVQPIDRLTRFT